MIVTDSFTIAEYLDAKYPSRPLFPDDSRAIFSVLAHWINTNVMTSLLQLAVAILPDILDDRSQDWFLKSRSSMYKKDPRQVCQGEERTKTWLSLWKGLDRLAEHLSRNGSSDFIIGRSITYADFLLAALFIWAQKVPTTCDPGMVTLWDGIKDRNDGRWMRFMGTIDEFRKNEG